MDKLEKHFELSTRKSIIAGNGKTVSSWQTEPSKNHEEADTLIRYCLHEIGGSGETALVF